MNRKQKESYQEALKVIGTCEWGTIDILSLTSLSKTKWYLYTLTKTDESIVVVTLRQMGSDKIDVVYRFIEEDLYGTTDNLSERTTVVVIEREVS